MMWFGRGKCNDTATQHKHKAHTLQLAKDQALDALVALDQKECVGHAQDLVNAIKVIGNLAKDDLKLGCTVGGWWCIALNQYKQYKISKESN